MRKQIALMGLILSCSVFSFGQEFEAASIRPSPEMNATNGPVFFGSKGGPGTGDPVRYWCNFCEASDLISKAYGVPEYRIVDTKHLSTNRFHVVATIAPGTTQDQFRLMLQHLLAERFGLKAHHETREMRAYRLLVSRGGAKLKPHVEGAPAEAKSGGEKAQPGHYYKTQATLADFANVVENTMGQPVVDATGLAGKYDFDLSWSFDDLDAVAQTRSDLPTLRSAIQQLGLQIDSHKEQVDVIVVDEMTKIPTEN